MNKLTLLKATNLLLFISMLAQGLTGIVMFFDLFTRWAKIFEMITEIHRYNGLALAVLVVIHIILNWGWVRSQFFKKRAV